MQDKRNRVTVNIMGNEYTMVGSEPEEYIQSIAYYVDKKMKEIHQKHNRLNNMMVAVLTALNIADEYFKLQHELEMARKEALKPGKELEEARYQLRKAREEIAALYDEMDSMKQQLANSQEEASNIYNEWLKAQKEIKDLKSKLAAMEEINRELEVKLSKSKAEEERLREELEEFIKTFDTNNLV